MEIKESQDLGEEIQFKLRLLLERIKLIIKQQHEKELKDTILDRN